MNKHYQNILQFRSYVQTLLSTRIPFPEKVYSIELAGNFTIRISRAAEIVYPTLFFSLFFFVIEVSTQSPAFLWCSKFVTSSIDFLPQRCIEINQRNAKRYSAKNGKEERWDRVSEWKSRNKRKLPSTQPEMNRE